MWANAQRDGRPAEYRWRSVVNAAVWLARPVQVPCSNALPKYESVRLGGCKVNFAPGRPVEICGVPQTTGPISAASLPKFIIL